jgi:hypothetical protein
MGKTTSVATLDRISAVGTSTARFGTSVVTRPSRRCEKHMAQTSRRAYAVTCASIRSVSAQVDP